MVFVLKILLTISKNQFELVVVVDIDFQCVYSQFCYVLCFCTNRNFRNTKIADIYFEEVIILLVRQKFNQS